MSVETYSDFQELPEGCIATALSLTTPNDACRLSLVSTTFRSAAESDAVWERFLPPDYRDIILRLIDDGDLFLAKFRSKKELYFHLCDNPIIIDGGIKVMYIPMNFDNFGFYSRIISNFRVFCWMPIK